MNFIGHPEERNDEGSLVALSQLSRPVHTHKRQL